MQNEIAISYRSMHGRRAIFSGSCFCESMAACKRSSMAGFDPNWRDLTQIGCRRTRTHKKSSPKYLGATASSLKKSYPIYRVIDRDLVRLGFRVKVRVGVSVTLI